LNGTTTTTKFREFRRYSEFIFSLFSSEKLLWSLSTSNDHWHYTLLYDVRYFHFHNFLFSFYDRNILRDYIIRTMNFDVLMYYTSLVTLRSSILSDDKTFWFSIQFRKTLAIYYHVIVLFFTIAMICILFFLSKNLITHRRYYEILIFIFFKNLFVQITVGIIIIIIIIILCEKYNQNRFKCFMQ